MAPKDCPDIRTLKLLLAHGLSDEQELSLSAHLDQCADCRERLERVAAGDRTLHDVARNLRSKTEMTDALKTVIEKCSSDPFILLRDVELHPPEPRYGSDHDIQIADLHRERDEQTFRGGALVPRTTEVMYSPGDRLGQYEILEEVGRGGMGVVYKARDPDQNRFVAIKVLHGSVLTDKIARRRFVREARAASAVDHRNVVKLYRVEDSPVPYMVMEFVDGPSLRAHMLRKGCLDLGTVLKIGLQIAKGLEASHARGVVHRDVKPANIVLDIPSGRAKLTDFGLAQIEGDIRLTLPGFTTGTPAFMSPEQASGASVDHRSDLFSLGSVMYAMATGQSPFEDDQTCAALDLVVTRNPQSPQIVNPDIPASLSNLIRRLHAKRANERPATATEVVQILQQQLEELTHPREAIVLSGEPEHEIDSEKWWKHRTRGTSASMATIDNESTPVKTAPRSEGSLLVLAIILALVALVGVSFLLTS
ncbi:MAG: serine/threonine protein kinase [Planctomycetes bacterium]|nr:serine/threonine protein kinase [Planctomycetota bacterium]